jgi:hypothetical protein
MINVSRIFEKKLRGGGYAAIFYRWNTNALISVAMMS